MDENVEVMLANWITDVQYAYMLCAVSIAPLGTISPHPIIYYHQNLRWSISCRSDIAYSIGHITGSWDNLVLHFLRNRFFRCLWIPPAIGYASPTLSSVATLWRRKIAKFYAHDVLQLLTELTMEWITSKAGEANEQRTNKAWKNPRRKIEKKKTQRSWTSRDFIPWRLQLIVCIAFDFFSSHRLD